MSNSGAWYDDLPNSFSTCLFIIYCLFWSHFISAMTGAIRPHEHYIIEAIKRGKPTPGQHPVSRPLCYNKHTVRAKVNSVQNTLGDLMLSSIKHRSLMVPDFWVFSWHPDLWTHLSDRRDKHLQKHHWRVKSQPAIVNCWPIKDPCKYLIQSCPK